MDILRLRNKAIAKVITRFPSLSKRFIDSYTPWEAESTPWTPVTELLRDSKVAIVTTSGVHHKDQHPFDMDDNDGDPSFRKIDIKRPLNDLMITHDYYDHSDADKDINIVFPVERLREFRRWGLIGGVADKHYSFMGHIDGRHIKTLINDNAPEVAKRLKEDDVDIVILTPG
jgi:D-proline reductase (dithiol) PrdB